MDKAHERNIYEFEDFRLDADHLMLYRHGREAAIVPKAIEILLVLIEHRGQIVSKDDLLKAVWPDRFVEESNIFLYLSLLRKTLGKKKNGEPYIETRRRRGYWFSGDARLVQWETEPDRHAPGIFGPEDSGTNFAELQSGSARDA